MSRPRFRNRAFSDHVARRGATTHRAGLDPARRLANTEAALQSGIGLDTDELNLYRALGSSLLTYNFDPGMCANATDHQAPLTTGNVYLQAVYLPTPATVTGVAYYVNTAGVGTWNASGNKVGVYSAGGTRLAVSANDSTKFTSTGFKQFAFTGTVDLDRGVHYLAIVNSRSATTTSPQIACRTSFATTLGSVLTAASFPRGCAFVDTDLAVSYTLSAGNISSVQRWLALY